MRKMEGMDMSKNMFEMAAELTMEIIKAKGQIIATFEHGSYKENLMGKYLSDETISHTFRAIYNTMKELESQSSNEE